MLVDFLSFWCNDWYGGNECIALALLFPIIVIILVCSVEIETERTDLVGGEGSTKMSTKLGKPKNTCSVYSYFHNYNLNFILVTKNIIYIGISMDSEQVQQTTQIVTHQWGSESLPSQRSSIEALFQWRIVAFTLHSAVLP